MDKLTEPWHYDRTEAFETNIRQRIDELYDLCKKHGIPLVIAAQFASGEEHDMVSATAVAEEDSGRRIDMAETLLAAYAVVMHFNLPDKAAAPVKEFIENFSPIRRSLQQRYVSDDPDSDCGCLYCRQPNN